MNKTPNLFVKLDNGTYVLNDYSSTPDIKDIQCPPIYNITQSTQQCSISQAQVAVKSSANSFNYYPSSSSSFVMSVSISILIIQHLTTYNNIINNYYYDYDNNNDNNNNENEKNIHHNHNYDNDQNINIRNNYMHLNLVKNQKQLISSINCIVAQLISHWTNLVWNFLKVIALQIILLQLAIRS